MVEFYEYEGLGYIVDPESDTKQVFIPSPPTMTTVKTNPRPGIIYITGGKVKEGYEKLEDLKNYAEENKVMIICPASLDPEEIAETYKYVTTKYKVLNVKRDELSYRATLILWRRHRRLSTIWLTSVTQMWMMQRNSPYNFWF